MKITQFTDYSLRLLMFLANNRHRRCTVKEISDHYEMSSEHLKKIVRRLTGLGIIQTVRGKNGGLGLACEPSDINLGQLFRAEENLCLLPCFEGASCPVAACKLRGVVDEALAAFLGTFDRHTLADIV